MIWPGLPRRRLDQLRQPATAATAPGSTSVVRARLVIVFGPAGTVSGVFVYPIGTTPGPGNPATEAISNASVDPFGNAIHPGIMSQIPGGAWVSMFQGELNFRGGSSVGGTAGGNLVINAPGEVAFEGGPLNAPAGIAGSLSDPSVITNDAGTAASSFGADWAPSGAGFDGVTFILGNDGIVRGWVDVHTTGAAPATEICAIPAAYEPASSGVCGLLWGSSGTSAFPMTVTGTLLEAGAIPATSGVRYTGTFQYPLASI